MIIIDKALEKREEEHNPVRVGIIGAGYMGKGIAMQITTATQGMSVSAISNRTIGRAAAAYHESGIDDFITADSVMELDGAVTSGRGVITDDARLLCRSETIDVIIETTGAVEFGAQVVMEAIRNGKHVVLCNAELDATVGPLLNHYAGKKEVILSNIDGDQPGMIMNMIRYVRTIGYKPVLAGNVKGLQDAYRTPATQKAFAEMHGQSPEMATSFADGTKISFEMAVVANATGFKAGRRGMYGPKCDHVDEAPALFPAEEMLEYGLVDYVLGAQPPGIFVIGYNDDPVKRQYMKYYKMGEGPFYVFYAPYHLPSVEAPLTAARVALFNDAAIRPAGGPVCEVITTAKKDLKAGERLDGPGGFTCYGQLENYEQAEIENALPMGISVDCIMKRDKPKDSVLTYEDVTLPEGRLCDKLREEQKIIFSGMPVSGRV